MANYTGSTVLEILQNNNIPDDTHQFTAGGFNINSTNIKVKNFYSDQTVTPASVNTLFDDLTVDHQYTCVRIFHGNLTISGNYAMTPPRPVKGLFIYVKGKLTIQSGSRISMTGEGATGAGVDVYLATVSGTDVFVPANSVRYGTPTIATNQARSGNTPENAPNRETGGGGGGGASATGSGVTATGGAGSVGTSWSGGSGGGAAAIQGTGATSPSGAAGTSGGAGGNARTFTTVVTSRYAGGGAGNNGGAGREIISAISALGTAQSSLNGLIGTGGLLVVYTRLIENAIGNTAFSSKGLNGGGNQTAVSAGGGGSGGGSVNIFHMFERTNFTDVHIDVAGGNGGLSSTTASGGAGGAGSKTISALTPETLSLFVSGNYYFRYRQTSFNTYTWENVGSAQGSTTDQTEIFKMYGMSNFDVQTSISKSALQDLSGVDMSAVQIRSYFS
jgi:hypothetical protein